jgi:glycerol-3-phosphate dehydrogenase (NAD(P)+)
MKSAVIGSGSFGTAMANVLATKGFPVRVWARDAPLAKTINETHENATYLPGIPLAPSLRVSTDIGEVLDGAELVVMATPTQVSRGVLETIRPLLHKPIPMVSLSKGIERHTLLTMTEMMEEVLPSEYHPYFAVLSGPSFAKEVARGMPTAVTVASIWDRVAQTVQHAFATEYLRSYTSHDLIGVQFGGALKNVIAIAAGISDGLGFGYDARAALMTRGLAEIARAAARRGANPLTLSGLSGMGDLVLTCTGELSRNRTVGLELGRGRKLADIVKSMKQVAEGVQTAESAKDLAAKLRVDMPICEQVFSVVHEDRSPREAVVTLMTRELRAEL